MKKDTKPQDEVWKLKAFKFKLVVFTFVTAVLLAAVSICHSGWSQNLILGIATGIFTSSLISLIMLLYQEKNEKINRLNDRIKLMDRFKTVAYNLIHNINFAKINNRELTVEDYIKEQHRWFHEYFKRIVAKSDSEEETQQRMEQIREFYNGNLYLKFLFENYNPDAQAYMGMQYSDLISFREKYFLTWELLSNNKADDAIFWFSEFLEIFKRLISEDEFYELNNFNKLKFNYDDLGHIAINYTEFEQSETQFKFAREFNQIRTRNYKKYYSKHHVEE